jgi:hypothetical protein
VKLLRPRFLRFDQEPVFKPRAKAAALLVAAGLLCGTNDARAIEDGPWPSGVEIAQRINARDDGTTVAQTVIMELIDRRGNRRLREPRGFRKDHEAVRRTVIFFQRPKNVKGTAFLTFDYPERDRDDDQWLYLPALRKVRRISAADRGSYFLGTDFTYEDIKQGTKVGVADYSWKTVGEEVVDGRGCYVVEAIPVSQKVAKELGYGRARLWVDPQIWMARKGEFWDVRGNPLKSVFTQEIRQVQGIWTTHRFEAHNHKTGHRSIFKVQEVDYQGAVDDELFTQRALQRGP